MNAMPHVLVFDAAPHRAGELDRRLRGQGFASTRMALADATGTGVDPGDSDLAVVLLDPQKSPDSNGALTGLVSQLASKNVATLVCGAGDSQVPNGGALVEWVDSDVGLDEVVAKVGTLARYAPIVKGLERELHHLHRLGEQLNRYFSEIDQEMRLAGRLQRDFLPRKLPGVGPYQFEVYYRPATWVSGDTYDVFRIDEHHIGMYVADAMGHGVAAGLLTMFLRQALEAKRVNGHSYSIVQPADALRHLHACLARQKLPNSQFVTAVYAVIDTRRGEFRVARAGHPYPLHIRRGGQISEIRSSGSLLGLVDVPAEFEETSFTLEPGDKIVFYTDGIEDLVIVPGKENNEEPAFTPQIQQWAPLSANGMIGALGDYLECQEGSLHPADDVTMVLLEMGER